MCCRYHLREEHFRDVLTRLGIPAPAKYLSRYNIAPGGGIPAVRTTPQEQARESISLRWGLTPAWAQNDEPATRMVNARAETLVTKPSFRDAARSRRCVIPASGFYEWQVVEGARRPWVFRRRDERPFGLAGIWEQWTSPDGVAVESCAVITCEPNELMRPIHHRMPAMLDAAACERWLDPGFTDLDRLATLLQPAPANLMTAAPVSTYVSNAQHEGPECLAPYQPDAPRDEPQFSLGL